MAAIKFPEGTTFRQQFTINDSSGTPIDLTGASLTWAAYLPSAPTTGTPTPFLEKTVGLGITVTDAVNGIIRIDFIPVDTTDSAGNYQWELQLVEANGDVWLAGTGQLLVQPARRLDN